MTGLTRDALKLVIPAKAGIAPFISTLQSDPRVREDDGKSHTRMSVAHRLTVGGIVILLTMLFAVASMTCLAQSTKPDTPITYRSTTEETRFHALTSSLRCVMCQNESLADSDAPIAHDLRREIIALMRDGKSDAQIRDFLVARYGEFVLYQPRVEPATWLLWFGPLLLLVAGGVTVLWIVRRRAIRARSAAAEGSAAAMAPESRDIESSEEW